MGYTTKFKGQIKIDPPLEEHEVTALRDHYSEDSWPGDVPKRSYCQWVPTKDGAALEWDGMEKFNDSALWMQYLMRQFFAQSHKCNGEIFAQGEQVGDVWKLIVRDNEVTTQYLGL